MCSIISGKKKWVFPRSEKSWSLLAQRSWTARRHSISLIVCVQRLLPRSAEEQSTGLKRSQLAILPPPWRSLTGTTGADQQGGACSEAFVAPQTSVTPLSAASFVPQDSNWPIFLSVSCLCCASRLFHLRVSALFDGITSYFCTNSNQIMTIIKTPFAEKHTVVLYPI